VEAHPEDLSLGTHPFCVGETSPDAIAQLQELARKYDLISSDGASPSRTDAQELVGIGTASIPSNLIALDAQNQLFLVLLRVFLGTDHAITVAWEVHTTTTQQRLLHLQFYSPRTARHQLLLPGRIQRWCQLRFSYWIERQWDSMNDIAAPAWDELWMHITLKTNWESPLPERYLAPLNAQVSDDSSQMSGITRGTTGTTSSGAYSAGTGGHTQETPARQAPAGQENSVAEKCELYIESYAPFRASGKRVREIIKAIPSRRTIKLWTCASPTTSRGYAIPTADEAETTPSTTTGTRPVS
jgi:hypothetical protein